MKKTTLCSILSIFSSLFLVAVGVCLDGEDIIRLKQAGIGDDTIQLMLREKTTETCAFTVQELIDLKKGGVSDQTIKMLINEGSFLKDKESVVYGKNIRPIKFTTAKDIIELRDAGLSDETIRAIIRVGSGNVNDVEREKAWEMLNDMGIVIDRR
jgi:hypothetical protein